MRKQVLYNSLISILLLQSCAGGDITGQQEDESYSSINTFSSIAGYKTAGTSPADVLEAPVGYDIYMDNSLSMNGYFKGKTEFISVINRLITQVSIYADNDQSNCNLHYFNNGINFCGNTKNTRIDNYLSNVDNFFAKEKLGNRGVTELKDILNSVLDSVRNNSVSIIITDGIASPGVKGQDAATYFDIMENSLYRSVYNKLSKSDFATTIIKCNSEFNGTYINQSNKGVKFEGKRRPYFIIVAGNEKGVSNIANAIRGSVATNGYEACYSLGNIKSLRVKSKMLLSPDYVLAGNASELKVKTTGSMGSGIRLRLLADFRNIPVNEEYLLNPDNYKVSPANAKLTIVKVANEEDPANRGYTHKLLLVADNFHTDQNVSVTLRCELPQWVYDTNTDSDLAITDSSLQGKTLGFLHIVKGIQAGYKERGLIEKYFSLNVKIYNAL